MYKFWNKAQDYSTKLLISLVGAPIFFSVWSAYDDQIIVQTCTCMFDELGSVLTESFEKNTFRRS